MDFEKKEQLAEIKKLGNIEVTRTLEGRILKINDMELQEGDKILIIQRHQKPEPFTKEQLIQSPSEGIKELSNLDYWYEPATNKAGTEAEEKLLNETLAVLGKMDFIATTPRKRGSEHKKLLEEKFPEAKKDESIDKSLDDSAIGLMGESFYSGYTYTPEEAKRLFKPTLTKELKFGRGPYRGKKKPSSYMETWVQLGYLKPENKWKVESPEELARRTERLLSQIQEEKNYFITHEENCVVFHMLAGRDSQELQGILGQVDIPGETRIDIEKRLDEAKNILDVFKLVKQSLSKHPVRGYHYKKALASLLENVRLKSGEKGKGYGAVSIYVLREQDGGQKNLIETAYDEQV